jgi:hypothetical protein
MLQRPPPDPPRYDPDHRLTYKKLPLSLKWKYDLDIPLSTLYGWKYHKQLPEPVKFRKKPMWRVRDIDAWVANGGQR